MNSIADVKHVSTKETGKIEKQSEPITLEDEEALPHVKKYHIPTEIQIDNTIGFHPLEKKTLIKSDSTSGNSIV